MPVIKTRPAQRQNPSSGFICIQVALLKRLRTAAVDVFVQSDPKRPPVLHCRAGHSLEPQHLFGLADAGVERVYVRSEDFQGFGSQLFAAVESDNEREPVPAEERFAAMQLAVAVEIERTAQLLDCGPYIALSERTGRELAAMLATTDVLPRDLFRLARHDFNTFTHVTNVASYILVLAKRLGVTDRGDLEALAIGAMLHDVGKRHVPASILNKPSRLDPPERELIELHPTRGFEDLCDRPELSDVQLLMVYQHHERVDGGGYPVGVRRDQIHPWARMLAVVDVFDAMTGVRHYRRPASARDALSYIQRSAGTHFDPEIAACWISAMSGE